MLRFLSKQDRNIALQGTSYLLDLSRLKQGELLEFRYGDNQQLLTVRKLEHLSPGGIATAETDIKPGDVGQVLWNGSYWSACCDGERAIHKGQSVFVLAREGLTLFVTAA